MSVVEPGSAGAGLFARVRDMIARPGATWDVVDGETADVGSLYRGYVMPLAAIPVVATAVGMIVFGIGAFGITLRPSPIWVIANAVVQYVLNLAMVYVIAMVIEGLAENFGGQKNRMQAFKVAAYAPTASWVAGVFGLVPALALLAIVGGVYSLWTLYLGLPKLMKAPQERAGGYFAVVLVVSVVIAIVIGLVSSSIMGAAASMNTLATSSVSGTLKAPGGSVDVGKLEALSKQAEAAAKRIEDGKAVAATDPEVLKGYLPTSVAGFTRGEVGASAGAAGGVEGSQADARYQRGDATLRLEVTDLGGAGALAGMASAFKVKSSRETSTGYEKVDTVGGRMTTETYDRASKHGEYGVLVAERFMVQASGDGVTMDELKAAVNAVGLPRLESLAKGG